MSTSKHRKAAPSYTPERRYLRIAEAAEYLNGTTWYVRTLIWGKKIPYLQIGKRFVLDKADLDAYMQSAKSQ